MKIAFVLRHNYGEMWGGDLKALNVIKEGLEKLDHQVSYLSASEITNEDLIFLSNTTTDISPSSKFISCFLKKRYSLIPFHEDFIKYQIPALGLQNYIHFIFSGKMDENMELSIERLIENPSIVYYYSFSPIKISLLNYDAIKNAEVCIANSKFERKTLLRDCPSSNSKVVYWTSGCEKYNPFEDNDSFLRLSGLKKGEYVLQVGRLQARKNQLTSILAMKDLDIPLVFIATSHNLKIDFYLILETILKFRKAPTIIVSQDLPEGEYENLRIINMPGGKILSDELLQSAFSNCGLYLHPAFYELPGYVYIEAAFFGVPVIASNWTSLKEYFSDRITGKYLLDDRISYVDPLDIQKITKLIKSQFGKRYPKCPDLWIYKRKPIDVASEILSSFSK